MFVLILLIPTGFEVLDTNGLEKVVGSILIGPSMTLKVQTSEKEGIVRKVQEDKALP